MFSLLAVHISDSNSYLCKVNIQRRGRRHLCKYEPGGDSVWEVVKEVTASEPKHEVSKGVLQIARE